MGNLYLCTGGGDKEAEEIVAGFPETITMTFNGYVRQGCNSQDHSCSGGGSVNIYTAIYNYLTVLNNSRFTNISTGPVAPNTMLTANYSASSSCKGGNQGNNNSDASLQIRLERR